jgi:hypothetical protein
MPSLTEEEQEIRELEDQIPDAIKQLLECIRDPEMNEQKFFLDKIDITRTKQYGGYLSSIDVRGYDWNGECYKYAMYITRHGIIADGS